MSLFRQMHYPPETTTIMLFAKILAMVHQTDNKEGILNLLNQVLLIKYEILFV